MSGMNGVRAMRPWMMAVVIMLAVTGCGRSRPDVRGWMQGILDREVARDYRDWDRYGPPLQARLLALSGLDAEGRPQVGTVATVIAERAGEVLDQRDLVFAAGGDGAWVEAVWPLSASLPDRAGSPRQWHLHARFRWRLRPSP